MATAHWIIQGKGGVGKSLIAALLAQDLLLRFEEAGATPERAAALVRCFDTDPANATLAGYAGLHALELDIMDESGTEIDARRFDTLVEHMAAVPGNAHVIIDNGASSFFKLCSYIKQSAVFELLQEQGFELCLHTVVTGGQAAVDTLNNMDALVKNFAVSQCDMVVWRNSYFGPVEVEGVDLEQLAVWRNNSPSIQALVSIPLLPAQTYGVDLQNLLSRRQTFAEAVGDARLQLMERHRLGKFWEKMRQELAVHLPLHVSLGQEA